MDVNDIDTGILITLDGDISIVKFDFNDLLKDKDLCAPYSKKGYQVSVAVKLFSTYKNKNDIKINTKATDLFKHSELCGDVYVLIDPKDTKENLLKEIDRLYNDLKNGLYN